MGRIWDDQHSHRVIDWRRLAPLRTSADRSAPTRRAFTIHPDRSAYATAPDWTGDRLARLASPPDTTPGGGVAP